MDLINQAQLVSSLSRALEGSVTLQNYIPSVPKSMPSSGREVIIVPFDKSQDVRLKDKRVTLTATIPKAGSLTAAFVRITYSGAKTSGGALNTKRLYFAKGGIAYAAVEMLRYMTNSRELARITGAQTKQFVDTLDASTRDAYNKLAGVGLDAKQFAQPKSLLEDPLGIMNGRTEIVGGAAVAKTNDIVVYCPVTFSTMFPQSTPGCGSTDAQFLEELSLECTLRGANEIIRASKVDASVSAPSDVAVDLCLCYRALNDSDRAKVISQSYKSGRPLQLLSTSYEQVGYETFVRPAMLGAVAAGGVAQEHTFKIRSSSSALVRSLTAIVTQVDGQTCAATQEDVSGPYEVNHSCDFVPIKRLRFEAGGRKVFDISPTLSLGASMGAHYGTAPGGLQNSLTYRFCTDSDRTRYSGALALAGCSSQTFACTALLPRAEAAVGDKDTAATLDTATTFACELYAEKIVALTISPSDGSIRPSLST